jgi:hypothetical protein
MSNYFVFFRPALPKLTRPATSSAMYCGDRRIPVAVTPSAFAAAYAVSPLVMRSIARSIAADILAAMCSPFFSCVQIRLFYFIVPMSDRIECASRIYHA